jgi:hypothetical protein
MYKTLSPYLPPTIGAQGLGHLSLYEGNFKKNETLKSTSILKKRQL